MRVTSKSCRQTCGRKTPAETAALVRGPRLGSADRFEVYQVIQRQTVPTLAHTPSRSSRRTTQPCNLTRTSTSALVFDALKPTAVTATNSIDSGRLPCRSPGYLRASRASSAMISDFGISR